ncbi:AMIN domain-containing protein [Rubellimicrobium sp. CFH 75288]|nr:AMIN domain-containing protein [Rubellimicrobium sp. CFH 75288]
MVAAVVALILPGAAAAQALAGLARVEPAGSRVADEGRELAVDLSLSQAVPWRAFTLDAPPRLVLDFREADFRAVDPAAFLRRGLATDVRFGSIRPGWSRMVVVLDGPLGVREAGMQVDPQTGRARLVLRLAPQDAATFAAEAGPPPGPDWELELAVPDAPPPPPVTPADDGRFVVVIDPGHGGIDPGAERGGLRESHLMLALGIELADAVSRAGMVAVLTRREDVFVPLQERMTIARAAGADLLISLHADALEEDQARGASVYTLSREAADRASARLVERHGGDDLIAGLDLTGQGDAVAQALLDLARQDSGPRSEALGDAIARGLSEAGAVVNSRPRRQAPLAVLNAADFPSVLVETGFLSDAGDRARLATPEGRASLVAGILAGIVLWRQDEDALRPLRRR